MAYLGLDENNIKYNFSYLTIYLWMSVNAT